MKTYGGQKCYILIRRLLCENCGTLHNELPDILVPRKHYTAEVIENVVDDVVTSDDPIAENYPCEKTMQRWKEWISINTSQIDGVIKSAGYRILGLSEAWLKSGESVLSILRETGADWLCTCCRAVYNTGNSLLTRKPDKAPAPALFCDREAGSGTISAKEVIPCKVKKSPHGETMPPWNDSR